MREVGVAVSEGLGCAVAAGLMLCASGRVSTGDVLNQEEEVPAMTKTQKGIRFRYGFRHDPMKWIHDKTRGLAVALSSETGDAVASVKLPDDVVRIGQLQDGRVALLTRLPGDDDAPATTWAFDPTLPQPPTKVPDAKWRGNENEWCLYDFWGGPPILHKRPKHPLAPDIDSGDAPFRQYTTGVASDGTNLWVLDNKDKRVCIVEKAKSGKHPTVPINK